MSPDGSPLINNANTTNQTATFSVHNTSSSAALTFALTCSATGGVSCVSVSPSSLSLDAAEDENVTVTYSVGSTGGTLTLNAYEDTFGVSDDGSYNVALRGKPAIALTNTNGDNQDRSLCLTAGAGHSAAYQCGDLTLTHSMPGYATMGRERAPTLIFTTSQSAPVPFAHVLVTLGGTVAPPDSVYVELQVNGGSGYTARRTGTWNGWGSAGSATTREIGMAYSAGEATGAYPFRIVVRNIYSGVGSFADTVSGKFLVLNRSASNLGRGWSMAGVEWIHSQSDGMIWVGGDGSIKLYPIVNDTTWIAPPGGFRDTLVYHASTSTFVRTLKDRVQVTYDAGGRHTQTTNRTGQVTRFWWTTSPERLDSISVPPGGSGTVYRLAYDGNGYLDKITDPVGRVLDATVASGKLVRLTDPDTLSTFLHYDSYGNIVEQQPRMRDSLTTGWTTYAYANGIHLTQASIPLDSLSGTSATTQYLSWDEKDLGANGGAGNVAALPDSLYTGIYGPRVSVADDAKFWVNRFGTPWKTQDAMGAVTTIDYDSTYTALAKRVTYANGRIITLQYGTNGHANLTQVRDSTWYLGAAGQATRSTSYTYGDSNNPDSPTQVADALGRTSTYTYHATLGITTLATDPRGHETEFNYGTLSGLAVLDSVTERNVATWAEPSSSDDTTDATRRLTTKFVYDARGNVTQVIAPNKLVTAYVRDTLERVTDVYDLLGTRNARAYNPINQVTTTTQYLSAQTKPYSLALTGGTTCDTQQTICVDSTKADADSSSLPSTLVTQYAYSRWGIQSITDPRGVARSYRRDWNGQLTRETDDFGASKQQTYDAGGLLATTVSRLGETVTYQYDAAGRLTRVLYPPRVYASRSTPSGWTAKTIPGDSIRYTYDTMGNQTSAINSDAAIQRTFYADGSPRSVYFFKDFPDSLVYTYDASGARKTLRHISRLNGTWSVDSVTYVYNATTGDLDSMTVKWGSVTAPRTFAFQWDGLGRRRQITYPGGTTVKNRYDASGQLRRVVAAHTGGTNDVLNFTFRTKAVDVVGRALWQELTCGQYDISGVVSGSACGTASISTWNGYNRRGMLVVQRTNSINDSTRYDGSGNLVHRRANPAYPYTIFSVDTLHNELTAKTDSGASALTIVHDSSGSRTFESSTGTPWSTRGYYYDGLGRTVGMRNYSGVGGTLLDNSSACQYGPDGQMNRSCENNASSLALDGASTVAAYNGSGLASFVHGGGLDDPLIALIRSASGGATKELVFITDRNGRQFGAADSTGYFDPDLNEATQWQNWQYAGGSTSSNSFASSRLSSPSSPGLSFFRNRVYDQGTGRWTQEDPIGVAGGFNLYQFNGNNPVSFTDPFGLCIPFPSCAFAAAGAGARAGTLVGSGIGTAIEPVGGTAVGAAIGRLAGAAIGFGVAAYGAYQVYKNSRERGEIEALIEQVSGKKAEEGTYDEVSKEIHHRKKGGHGGSKNKKGDFTKQELRDLIGDVLGNGSS